MKILVVSNVYPPQYIGGYELGCEQIVNELTARGNDVYVLTSTYGIDRPARDQRVFRELKIFESWREEDDFRNFSSREIYNQRVFRRVIREIKPDLVYFFNMGMLSKSLLFQTARMKIPYSLYVSDNWLSLWRRDPWYRNWLGRRQISRRHETLRWFLTSVMNVLGYSPFDQDFHWEHSQFTSEMIKKEAIDAGLDVEKAQVIHWGVRTDVFRPDSLEMSRAAPSRLLYVGRLVPEKGLHIVIEALALLSDAGRRLSLTIVGEFLMDTAYEAQIRGAIADHSLEDSVVFRGKLSRDEVAGVYRESDILVFSSIWDEPFSITLLEAMASRLAVVSTDTGGSKELLVDSVNALIYAKDRPEHCAARISELLDDRDKLNQLAMDARATVESGFQFALMIDKIESNIGRAKTSRDG